MKFKLMHWILTKIGELIVNIVSSEQKKNSGWKLYIKIMIIFLIPVIVFEIGFFKIKEYLAVVIEENVIFKYWDFFHHELNISAFTLMTISYKIINIVRTLLIIAFLIYYRTTSDIITKNIIDELQEALEKLESETFDKKIVNHWVEHIDCNIYVYDKDLKILLISRHFKKWFKRKKISVTLCGMNVLRSPFCENKTYWKRTIFAFEQEQSEVTMEDIIFNDKIFSFEVTRTKLGNGDGIVVVTLKEL